MLFRWRCANRGRQKNISPGGEKYPVGYTWAYSTESSKVELILKDKELLKSILSMKTRKEKEHQQRGETKLVNLWLGLKSTWETDDSEKVCEADQRPGVCPGKQSRVSGQLWASRSSRAAWVLTGSPLEGAADIAPTICHPASGFHEKWRFF